MLQLSIHIFPSGRDSFLPLSERNERFIADQLIALVERGPKFEGVLQPPPSSPSNVGGRRGQECNRPVKCLQRGATEEIRKEERGMKAGGKLLKGDGDEGARGHFIQKYETRLGTRRTDNYCHFPGLKKGMTLYIFIYIYI